MTTLMKYFNIGIIFLLFTQITLSQSIIINEFSAINETTLADEDGDYSDWIEIYNASQALVNLQDWALTDDVDSQKKWLFPDVELKSGEYMVVFASSKNRVLAGKELHTNFNLSGSGEYLALVNSAGEKITEFAPEYPAQNGDHSYGLFENTYIEYSAPTPGVDNNTSTGEVIPTPAFSVKRGFFESPFQLELSSSIANAKIYYTQDGSAPSLTNGTLYSSAIEVTTSSVIRAVTTVDGTKNSITTTQTYLFLKDVINQSNTPEGYPTMWGDYTKEDGKAIADYEMDADMMKDPTFAASVKEALLDLPTISVVTDIPNLFSDKNDSETGGIYMYTGAPTSSTEYETGKGWERPASFEYFDADSLSLQVNCGLRLQGGHARRPEKSPKHSLMLVFSSQYGPKKLDHPVFGDEGASEYNKLILRAGFGNSWLHHNTDHRERSQYQRDIWTKDTQRKMGHPSSNSVYAHVYINGMYWGLYAPSERMDNDYGEEYFGGDKEDYDVIKDYSEAVDGEIKAWDEMIKMAHEGLSKDADYQRIQGHNSDGTPNPNIEGYVDVVSLADYMIINFFGANTDWDTHNWAAMRNRVEPGKGFKFLCWDGELIFDDVDDNELREDHDNCPSGIYQELLKNDDFKDLFANRIQKHCFNGGVLTPESNRERWLLRSQEIDKSINAESARWGDYRRDVHPYTTPGDLYTKESHWLPQQDYLIDTYFAQRTDEFVKSLQERGIFPDVDAPSGLINNNAILTREISKDDVFSLKASKGTIYYTLNGTDPKDLPKVTEALLYSSPLTINQSAHVMARAYYNGEWSAAYSQFLAIAGDYKDLKITEIHYKPLGVDAIDGNEFEFVELKNTGTSTLSLGGLQFVKGIDYAFSEDSEIRSGDFIVLASNSTSFYSRYDVMPFDEFKGKLDNNGEWLVMQNTAEDTIIALRYNDGGGWPTQPDELGYSLVPMVFNPTNNQTDSTDWRTSYNVGGSPNADDLEGQSSISEQMNDQEMLLAQNYPNPFSEVTYIDYQVPVDAFVQMAVYNAMGQQIAILVNMKQPAGHHQAEWHTLNGDSRSVSDGIYFYKLSVKSGNYQNVSVKKMILKRD